MLKLEYSIYNITNKYSTYCYAIKTIASQIK